MGAFRVLATAERSVLRGGGAFCFSAHDERALGAAVSVSSPRQVICGLTFASQHVRRRQSVGGCFAESGARMTTSWDGMMSSPACDGVQYPQRLLRRAVRTRFKAGVWRTVFGCTVPGACAKEK